MFQQTEQPPFIVPASELKQIRMLNVFEPCTLQIGDRNFYTLKDTDLVMTKTEWKRLERDQLSRGKAGKLKKVPAAALLLLATGNIHSSSIFFIFRNSCCFLQGSMYGRFL
jgi:hypothetical protein